MSECPHASHGARCRQCEIEREFEDLANELASDDDTEANDA